MQHYKTLLLTLLLGVSATLAQADLIVTQKNGKYTAFDLEKVHKITFANGQMHLSGAEQIVFALTDVRHLTFGKAATTGIHSSTTSTPLAYRNGKLLVNSASGHTAQVFTADGRLVWSAPVQQTMQTFDLHHLGRGFYLVKVGGETLKFVQ